MIFLVNGKANGEVLKLDEPLSFWGGVDPQTGEITDLRHPHCLLYTSPSPRDISGSRMPSSA